MTTEGKRTQGAPAVSARAGSSGMAAPDPVPLDERIFRWVRRATVVGIAFSLLFHLVAWFVAAHLGVGSGSGGGAAPLPSVVDFAIMTETELAEIADSSVSFEDPSVPEIQEVELPEIESLDLPTDADITGALEQIAPATLGTGAGDIGDTSGLGEGGSGSGSASFFGVEATGSRFVYIVDISGSMAHGGKLDALQRELVKSVESLLESADFLVITYSGSASPLEGKNRWVDADPRGKRFARRAIADLSASGGTYPGPAFRMAFALRPPPDSIYFMTDGEFNEEVALEIAMLNAEIKVPIHCIAFVSRESEEMMRRIASDSGGSYTFVPAPSGRMRP